MRQISLYAFHVISSFSALSYASLRLINGDIVNLLLTLWICTNGATSAFSLSPILLIVVSVSVIPLVQNKSFTFNKFLLFAGVPMRDGAQVADDTRVEGRFLAAYRTGINKRFITFRAST